MGKLFTIKEAAAELGVPQSSLENAALEHGYLIRMGRAKRIDPEQLPELVKKCRVQQKERGSTSTTTAHNGTSSTPAANPAQRAAQAAQRLKKPSQPTSPPKGGKVLPMNPKT